MPVVVMEALDAPTSLFADNGAAYGISRAIWTVMETEAIIGMTDVHAAGNFLAQLQW